CLHAIFVNFVVMVMVVFFLLPDFSGSGEGGEADRGGAHDAQQFTAIHWWTPRLGSSIGFRKGNNKAYALHEEARLAGKRCNFRTLDRDARGGGPFKGPRRGRR